MATTPTNAEANNGPESGKFDTVKALNTEGFTSFLAKFEDAKKGDISPEDMQKRFEVFEMKNKVVEDIKGLYKDRLSEIYKINLDARSLECVDKHVSKMAVEDVDEFLSMVDKIKEHKEYPGKISAAEEAMKKVETDFEKQKAEIKDIEKTVENAKKGSGLMGQATMYAKLATNQLNADWCKEGTDIYWDREKLKKEGIPLTVDGLNKRTEDLKQISHDLEQDFMNDSTDASEKWANLYRGFDDLKRTMFANLPFHAEILKSAKTVFQNKVLEMGRTAIPKDTANALNELERVKYNSDVFGGDVLTEQELVNLEGHLSRNTELYVSKNVGEVIGNFKLGAKNFDRLADALKEITGLDELGSKKGEDAKEEVMKYIEQYTTTLTDSPEHIEKKILIKQLVLKLKASNSNK